MRVCMDFWEKIEILRCFATLSKDKPYRQTALTTERKRGRLLLRLLMEAAAAVLLVLIVCGGFGSRRISAGTR